MDILADFLWELGEVRKDGHGREDKFNVEENNLKFTSSSISLAVF